MYNYIIKNWRETNINQYKQSAKEQALSLQ